MIRQRLRVLHINLSTIGIQHYGILFARGLSEQDDIDTLTVLEKSVQQNKKLLSLSNGLNKKLIPCQRLQDRINICSTLQKIIADWKPDVIHDTAGSSFIYGATPLAFLSKDIPLAVTEHDPEPHTGMGKSSLSKFSRYVLRKKTTHIFVHGPQGKQILANHGVSSNRVSIIALGSYKSIFDFPRLREVKREENTILFFGELRPNKGFRLLLPIAERINAKYPNVKFIVAGPTKVARDLRKAGWEKELKTLLIKMRERPYFEIHDRYIDEDEVGIFFRRASLTLLPYLDATQSAIAMIAMPLGSVIIATRVGDLPYAIKQGETGLLTEPNVDSIVEGLSYALSNQEALKKISQKGKRWVEECCNWNHIARETILIYRKLVQSS